MLVNVEIPKFIFEKAQQLRDMLGEPKSNSPIQILHQIDCGQYLVLDRFFGPDAMQEDFYEFFHEWPEVKNFESALHYLRDLMKKGKWFPEYGTCDSPEQFIQSDYGRLVKELPHQFCILFSHFSHKNGDDFRWHKYGPYIGLRKPLYENFADEPSIKEVYQFQVFRKK